MKPIKGYDFQIKVRYTPVKLEDTKTLNVPMVYTKVFEGYANTLYDVYVEADNIMETVPRKLTIGNESYQYACHSVVPTANEAHLLGFFEARKLKKKNEMDKWMCQFATHPDPRQAFKLGYMYGVEKSRWKNWLVGGIIYLVILIGIVGFVGL